MGQGEELDLNGITSAVRFNISSHLFYQDLSLGILYKIGKTFSTKGTPLGVMQFYDCLCAKSGPLPKLT